MENIVVSFVDQGEEQSNEEELLKTVPGLSGQTGEERKDLPVLQPNRCICQGLSRTISIGASAASDKLQDPKEKEVSLTLSHQ